MVRYIRSSYICGYNRMNCNRGLYSFHSIVYKNKWRCFECLLNRRIATYGGVITESYYRCVLKNFLNGEFGDLFKDVCFFYTSSFGLMPFKEPSRGFKRFNFFGTNAKTNKKERVAFLITQFHFPSLK